MAAGGAGAELAQRGEVDGALDPDGRVVAGEPLVEQALVPPGSLRPSGGARRVEVDPPGDAEPDPPQRAAGRDLAAEALVEPRQPLEHGLRRGPVESLACLRDDPAAEVCDRDLEPPGRDGGDEEMAGVRPEAEQPRLAAAVEAASASSTSRPESTSSPTRWATR